MHAFIRNMNGLVDNEHIAQLLQFFVFVGTDNAFCMKNDISQDSQIAHYIGTNFSQFDVPCSYSKLPLLEERHATTRQRTMGFADDSPAWLCVRLQTVVSILLPCTLTNKEQIVRSLGKFSSLV